MRFGATPEAWDHFANTLGLKVDLLPVVSNPNAEISEASKMAALGKTPSYYNRDRKAIGFAGWTEHYTTNGHLQHWKVEPDYGIALQTRAVGAFDIDASNEDQADAIESLIIKTLDGLCLPSRTRVNSPKRLLAFRRSFPMTKRVIPCSHGIIEFLGDGQQFIAVGMHPSGAAYYWDGDRLPDIPEISEAQLEAVWQALVLEFATGDPTIARSKRVPRGGTTNYSPGDDPVADWLSENWETYDVGSDGQLYIACPFAGEHSGDSGPSSTAYFAAGTGGYQQGHFVCLHAHCSGRSDHDYLEATGFNVGQFEDLGGHVGRDGRGELGLVCDVGGGLHLPEDVARQKDGGDTPPVRPVHELGGRTDAFIIQGTSEGGPRLVRNKAGQIEATATNMFRAISDGTLTGRRVAYDTFTDTLVWSALDQPYDEAKWRALDDATATAIKMELEQRGFKPMSAQLFRDSVHAAGFHNKIDTACEWLGRRKWDGSPRIERFAIDCWGWADNAYSRAVSLYVWTALAGRVLSPGVQADMAPILVGLQGVRKTSAIKAMAPAEDMYTEIKLDANDADQSRQLRGKLIGELEELRGLGTRAIEEIKAFISRRRESWVPKFKEFENHFARRLIFFGTTNSDEFLADPTGERRWLPGECQFINLDLIVATRDQLWAEGAARFEFEGVLWQDAERLAEQEHPRFKIGDTWERQIARWLSEPGIGDITPLDKGYVTVDEVLSAALGVAMMHQNAGHAARAQRALKHLGLKRTVREIEGYNVGVFVK